MSNTLFKYAKFVDLLLQKTKESKIPWEYDFVRKTVSVWNNDVLLSILKSQDDNFDDLYSLSLFNKSGDYLEGFDDTTLSAIKVESEEENYFIRMGELFNIAMRQATGADKALDDFINAVKDDKLDIPF